MAHSTGMSACCLSGKLASGKPTGRVITIAGLQTYVAEPENGSTTKSVVFLTDIFGYSLPNIRLLADSYAKAGFYAYIPDIHESDSLDQSFLDTIEPPLPKREQLSVVEKAASTVAVGATLGPWLIKHREAVARPLVEGFISHVRMIPGTHKVGVIGFCWGGRYAILAAQKPFSGADGKGVDAAYALHPALLSIPADFENVVAPLSIALAEKDSMVGEKDQEGIKEALAKKANGDEGDKLESKVKVYKNQIHGFALRGDFSSEKDKEAMDEAEKEGIDWFNKYLSGP